METNPEQALVQTQAIRSGLQQLSWRSLGRRVAARCEVSYLKAEAPVTESSLGRELVYCIAHAIHHYAPVSVMARLADTELPELAGLEPKSHWTHAPPGLGPLPDKPLVVCSEENLLRYSGDPHPEKSVRIHELGHAIHEMTLRKLDPGFEGRLEEAFKLATAAGVWRDQFASVSPREYWAEGVGACFARCIKSRRQA